MLLLRRCSFIAHCSLFKLVSDVSHTKTDTNAEMIETVIVEYGGVKVDCT